MRSRSSAPLRTARTGLPRSAAAEPGARERAAAAERRWHRYAACGGKVGAAAAGRRADSQGAAAPHEDRAPWRNGFAVQAGRQVGAADGDQRIGPELQFRADERDLQRGGAGCVADEGVRRLQRERVQCRATLLLCNSIPAGLPQCSCPEAPLEEL